VVNPTSQRQSRPRDQPSDHPMTAPSVPGPALAWVRASDDTNTRARPNVEQFDPSQNVYPRITRRYPSSPGVGRVIRPAIEVVLAIAKPRGLLGLCSLRRCVCQMRDAPATEATAPSITSVVCDAAANRVASLSDWPIRPELRF
jgi:hypothetical protein